jgi:hypothetical protein
LFLVEADFAYRPIHAEPRRHHCGSLNFPFARSGRDILRALHILTC